MCCCRGGRGHDCCKHDTSSLWLMREMLRRGGGTPREIMGTRSHPRAPGGRGRSRDQADARDNGRPAHQFSEGAKTLFRSPGGSGRPSPARSNLQRSISGGACSGNLRSIPYHILSPSLYSTPGPSRPLAPTNCLRLSPSPPLSTAGIPAGLQRVADESNRRSPCQEQWGPSTMTSHAESDHVAALLHQQLSGVDDVQDRFHYADRVYHFTPVTIWTLSVGGLVTGATYNNRAGCRCNSRLVNTALLVGSAPNVSLGPRGCEGVDQ